MARITEDDLPIARDDPRFGDPEVKAKLIEFAEANEVVMRLGRMRRFECLFPDETFHDPYLGETFHARALYPKHMEFFRVGKSYRERAIIAGNRTGKTVIGGYETTCHLTGLYPPWWEGHRFARPITALASGRTSETTRDIVQTKLLGNVQGSGPEKRIDGTGILPIRLCGMVVWKSFPNLLDYVRVKHVSGGTSTLYFKSYEQGRGIFEGTELDWVWFDEEPPIDVYGEALVRTMTTGGKVILTFTPLGGWTETVEQFLGTPEGL